ncbi:MAG TPA: hypothetical protein VN878_07705 [Usitatibacter sp.]|nr:hypothetical protein [Usitatibacter sp.]
MRTRVVKYRAPQLPPILDIDEYGLSVSELEWKKERWVADDETPVVQMDEWPTEFED